MDSAAEWCQVELERTELVESQITDGELLALTVDAEEARIADSAPTTTNASALRKKTQPLRNIRRTHRVVGAWPNPELPARPLTEW